jgi:hypothetical protein
MEVCLTARRLKEGFVPMSFDSNDQPHPGDNLVWRNQSRNLPADSSTDEDLARMVGIL